eukprot:749445-Hanusia_phi.AAC.1
MPLRNSASDQLASSLWRQGEEGEGRGGIGGENLAGAGQVAARGILPSSLSRQRVEDERGRRKTGRGRSGDGGRRQEEEEGRRKRGGMSIMT